MIYRLRIGRWRFTFTIARTQEVAGVNSLLPDGKHILMWDFDESDFPTVRNSLELTQRTYDLPPIYILETKKGTNYFAYCFAKLDWRKAIEIIAFTKGVDWGFLKFGVFRGKFTLRVTPKCGRKPKLVKILPSDVPEDCFIYDLKNWVRYETLEDGQEVKLHELRLP